METNLTDEQAKGLLILLIIAVLVVGYGLQWIIGVVVEHRERMAAIKAGFNPFEEKKEKFFSNTDQD
ncbi:hypothetical protein EVB87_085 [Rhizobium phage RHph_N28_1]|nr:hypothetical protein EVB87_085 [Rhizobium phage RHph_N28_1]QIG74113.1 hypothetical protein EVC07_085 [Rhizobium phage RHph_N42]QXV73772.1 hypothetical protein [Rhizobium phage RHph_N46]